MPVQYMFPVNRLDDSINTWLNSGGGSGLAYLNINEGTSTTDDSDYVIYQSGADENPEITFGRLVVIPSSVTFTYRASGNATIDSIILRDTNNLTIASNTDVQNISGGFTNRTVTLSGVNSTRNYANAHVQFNFSGIPTDVAFSAMDLWATGDINIITNYSSLYLESKSKIRYPSQSGDRAWSSAFSSGFGGLPEELFSMFITGGGGVNNNLKLFLYQNNSLKLRPSGDTGMSGVWLNSDNTSSTMWNYINDEVENTLSDNDYIYNIQSGVLNRSDKLYWISDSGIFSSSLDGTSITKITDSNNTIRNSTHGCYDTINDYIYYGYEIGIEKITGFTQKDGFYEDIINNTFAGGMCFDPEESDLYSLSKEGNFYKINPSGSVVVLAPLAGNFKDTQNRRLRIDHKNRNIYAIAQDQTSTLSRLYKYEINNSGWTQLKTLSYGLFGGAFDVDVPNSSIYYSASPNDLSSTSFYGIVKEDMYSGTGTRIVEPSGSAFFQCQEMIVDTKNNKFYYVRQDNSGATLHYKTVRTELDGTSPSIITDIPEASGATVLMLNGPIYKSYIDFNLTDFNELLETPENSNKTISSAFVSAKVKDLGDYSYLTAKILRNTKTEAIWVPINRVLTKTDSSEDIKTIRIGKNNGYINPNYNTNSEWDNAILRLELSSINNDNSGQFKIYSSEVDITVNSNENAIENTSLFIGGVGSENISTNLFTMAGLSIGDTSLYIINTSTLNDNTTLYTTSHGKNNSNTTLYTVAMTKEQSNMNLFISGLTPVKSGIDTTLYAIGGSPNAVLHSPLYIKVDGAENRPYGKMNLFMAGTGGYPTTSRMNLFLKSDPIIVGGSTSLFVQNQKSGINKFVPLYLKTKEQLEQNSSMSLFIARDTESLINNTTLYVKANNGTNSGIPLYLYAMTSSNSGVNLVVPNVIGNSENTKTLYINGF